MVRLTPSQQAACIDAAPRMFEPVSGMWGVRGCTRVILRAARVARVREAVLLAWCNTAPRSYHEECPP